MMAHWTVDHSLPGAIRRMLMTRAAAFGVA